ncbi:hypothetical protein JS562_54815 [Agrobacterium sp. S2]|nr:hypothetical protein [Agrobacterium sp. S2]
MSAYAWTAVAVYLFSGLIADRVRMRTLSATGFFTTAVLTFWYAMLPSFGVLIGIFIGMGLSTILLWWGVRYKLVRLVSTEEDYSRSIGISYGFYGAAGLLIGVIGTWVLGGVRRRRAGRVPHVPAGDRRDDRAARRAVAGLHPAVRGRDQR